MHYEFIKSYYVWNTMLYVLYKKYTPLRGYKKLEYI